MCSSRKKRYIGEGARLVNSLHVPCELRGRPRMPFQAAVTLTDEWGEELKRYSDETSVPPAVLARQWLIEKLRDLRRWYACGRWNISATSSAVNSPTPGSASARTKPGVTTRLAARPIVIGCLRACPMVAPFFRVPSSLALARLLSVMR